MTSLFSPFDFFFFSKSIFSFIFLFSIFSFLCSFHSMSKHILVGSYSFLSSFFCSLKNKGMNKNSLLFFISIFLFLLILNKYSVFFYNFPLTSQINLVFMFSLGLWLSFILFSIFFSSKKFMSHLIPEGTPLPLVSLLFIIELVSNFIRPLTLMVRLVANILAGHLLMILLSSLVFKVYLTFPFYILLNMVELFVALIQAYIFSTMLMLYFSEV